MSSKKLNSILNQVPGATAKDDSNKLKSTFNLDYEENARIVASIPMPLKEEIRLYIRKNKGETEKTVLLKALKKMGFNVPTSWIVDKRSLR